MPTDEENKHLKQMWKTENSRIDAIYKTIGGIVLFLCCTAIAWAATNIINLKVDTTELRGQQNTITAKYDGEHNETVKQFELVDKRLDRLEQEVTHKLDAIQERLDKALEHFKKTTP